MPIFENDEIQCDIYSTTAKIKAAAGCCQANFLPSARFLSLCLVLNADLPIVKTSRKRSSDLCINSHSTVYSTGIL